MNNSKKLNLDEWVAQEKLNPKTGITEIEKKIILEISLNGEKFNSTDTYTLNELLNALVLDWREVSADFSYNSELIRSWINNNFQKSEVKEWINQLDLKVNEGDFAQWVRDVKGYNIKQVGNFIFLQPRFLQTLREEYQGIFSTSPAYDSKNEFDTKFYEGITRIFNDFIRKSVKEESKSETQIAFEKEEKIKKEFEKLKKSIIPFWFGRELEGYETNPDGSIRLDPKTNEEIPIWKTGTGFEVKDFESYKKYLEAIENILVADYDFPPYVFPNGLKVSTYEQFKLYALQTQATDYLRGNKLTFLATFIERYFQEEAMGQLRRHLVELFTWMKVDLKLHQPNFWKKIERFVEKGETPPPVPELPRNLQAWIERLDDFIEFCYGSYPEPLDKIGYLATKKGILLNFEILLTELWQKYLANPRLFIIDRGHKLVTAVVANRQTQDTTNHQTSNQHDRLLEKTNSVDSNENPIKSSIAENIKEWDRYKANLFKNQSVEYNKEHLNFDNQKKNEIGNDTEQQQETRTISRDVDPRTDARILEWVLKAVKEFLIYEDIKKKLDPFFYTLWEELPRQGEF